MQRQWGRKAFVGEKLDGAMDTIEAFISCLEKMNGPDFSWSFAPINDSQKRVMSDICKANGYLATRITLTEMGKDIKEAEAQALITGHEGAESVGAREAAAVDARARRRAEVEEQCASKIGTCLLYTSDAADE